MIVPSAIFVCSICGEVSTDICIYCTKDACSNHRCVRCKRCSDCCQCDAPLSAEEAEQALLAEAAAQQAVTDHQNGISQLPHRFSEPVEGAEPSEAASPDVEPSIDAAAPAAEAFRSEAEGAPSEAEESEPPPEPPSSLP
jgi:hypothetical protein